MHPRGNAVENSHGLTAMLDDIEEERCGFMPLVCAVLCRQSKAWGPPMYLLILTYWNGQSGISIALIKRGKMDVHSGEVPSKAMSPVFVASFAEIELTLVPPAIV